MPKTRRKVNIIGHRNPDTDSICSALAYTYLKNQLGDAVYEARRAGQINRETAFVLKHFGVEPPRLCTDVSPQVKDIDIREQPGIDKEMSIRAAWSMMRDTEIDEVFVVLTGVTGMVIGDVLLRWLPVRSVVARGALFGAAAHCLWTGGN